jgi:hypothetical protein
LSFRRRQVRSGFRRLPDRKKLECLSSHDVKQTTKNCPRCGQPLERRARDRFWERDFLRLLDVFPWKYWDCQITYYMRRRNQAKSRDELSA